MTGDRDAEAVREAAEAFVEQNPDADTMDVLARADGGIEPTPRNRSIAEDVLDVDSSGEPDATDDDGDEADTENADSPDSGDIEGRRDDIQDANPTPEAGGSGSRDHENPIDAADVTDEERAAMLLDYLDAFADAFGTTPLLMPLDAEGKAPWITGRCSLDSDEARAMLVDGYEAARQIDHEGVRGFALYAGRAEHGTEGVAFVDHDDTDAFASPTGDPTLEVLSGSGRGTHETYRNDPDDPVANARVGDNDGEVRAENWYVVVPGSIHPSGGVYHVVEDRDVATLSDADLNDTMRPSTARNRERTAPVRDADGEGDRPDDDTVSDRLDAAFENPHDGNRIEQVYNGHYRAAGFDDRSEAEFWLANRLDSWVGQGDPGTVERVMDRGNLQKWEERTDRSYRDSVLAGVGTQDWYYDLEYGGYEDEDAQNVAVLPDSPKIRAATADEWWRGSDAGADDPTISQADLYQRVRDAQTTVMWNGGEIVLDAIMGGGKTYNFFAALDAIAESGEDDEHDDKGAYFAPREELYDQAVEYARDSGFDDDEMHILPSIERHCPTWNGEYGDEQQDLVETLYRLGVKPKTIHNLLRDELGCCQDGECEYERRWDFDPDAYRLLIGHYAHANLPQIVSGRHVAFDEDPADAFTERLEGRQLVRGVNAFLGLKDSPPFDGFDDLIRNRNDPERREAGFQWYDEANEGEGYNFRPDEKNAVRFKDEGFHASAPLAVYAILDAEPIESDGDEDYPFESGSIPDPDGGFPTGAQFFTTSPQEDAYHVEFQDPPDLGYARSVIALDGTPLLDDDGEPAEWQNALGRPNLQHRRVLTDEQRAMFLTETQGNVYLQSSPYIKPYSSGEYARPEQDAAKLAAFREFYGDGDPATVFTDFAVEQQYEKAGFVDRGLAETIDHPGNLRGSDEYGDTRLAVQLGSSHHGDHELRRRAAWLDEAAEPTGHGTDRDYDGIGNAILRQMREAQSAQNALRVGRDGDGALFIFDTCAFPDWIPVEDELASVSLWSDTEQAIRAAWDRELGEIDDGGVRTDSVAAAVDVDVKDRHLRRSLNRLAEKGLVAKRDDPDDGRRTVWCDTGLGEIDADATADVDLPELAVSTDEGEAGDTDISHIGVNTWDVRNPVRKKTGRGATEHTGSSDGVAAEANVGDPPPG